MPELPEVETTRRGIAPHLIGQRVRELLLRRRDLRWPIPDALIEGLRKATILDVRRRAKYLLLDVERGSALLHLGMSGSLRVLDGNPRPNIHDHVDLVLGSKQRLRFRDPRRFGCLLWQPTDTLHPLLAKLGPEPLSQEFDGRWLHRLSRGRRSAIKSFVMDQTVVVGVGNIYAAEALFAAGIDPRREAGSVSLARYVRLADAIQRILTEAIERGGTTLRDFLRPDGAPGYFEQQLQVYGREGEPCRNCHATLKSMSLGQRASVWCPRCQR